MALTAGADCTVHATYSIANERATQITLRITGHTNPNAATSGYRRALGVNPLMQANRADSSRVEGIPLIAARAGV